MATVNIYNHTAKRFLEGSNATSDIYKVMLLNASATFNPAHTTVQQVSNAGTYEVYGSGWTQGGMPLTGISISTIDTNDAMFDASDLLVNITGGSLGPFGNYVLFNSTDTDVTNPPLAFWTLTTPQTVSDGGVAGVVWAAGGIFTLIVT